jgi:hypothetical protein
MQQYKAVLGAVVGLMVLAAACIMLRSLLLHLWLYLAGEGLHVLMYMSGCAWLYLAGEGLHVLM